MAELVGGALLGAVFGELLNVVKGQATKTARFKSLLKRLKETLERIEPKIHEMQRSSGPEDVRIFITYLNKGKELVTRCSRIKFWNVLDKFSYARKLVRLDDELLRLFQIDVPMKLMRNSMKISIGIDELAVKVDQLSVATIRAGGFSGVPELPGVVIGLDWHLKELKRRLLTDDTCVLVISAPGGFGKTTLAKMLCHDDDIKGIFGDNIPYVTVSRPSSLKIIAQKLFKHYGISNSEFQTDEEAKNQIENLMRQIVSKSNYILLVLDDVWSESESIIQDLKFQIPGYKILVTSRFLFPRFRSTYILTSLNAEDAKTLFCYSAFPNDGIPINVSDDLVNKMVKFCKGLPLALTVVGASLCGQLLVKWKITLKKLTDGQSILQSNNSLLFSLQTSIDALDEFPMFKESFLDLGLFPEDDQIAGPLLLDMWAELYNLDDEGLYASDILLELSSRSLINLIPIRKYAGDIEGYCNEHYVTQHDLLRELAILLSCQDPETERKRLFMEIHNNGFPTWLTTQIGQPIKARILSISTDETFNSSWYDLNAPNVEVLILNIRSMNYTLPPFIERMSQLKVLIITGYGVYTTRVDNLQILASLTNLKRIRFEHLSVTNYVQVIFTLQNLIKLTFVTCELGNAFKSDTNNSMKSNSMLPNLTYLEFDSCYDLNELPAGLCSLIHLKKLIITNCHELNSLPRDIGSLLNLEILNLNCCTKLQELPESIGSMHNLSLFDISDCLSITVLPEQIGELISLRVLKMSGCQGLQGLPVSVSRLLELEDVVCDEETSYLWKNIQSHIFNVKINVVEEDRFGSFKKICR